MSQEDENRKTGQISETGKSKDTFLQGENTVVPSPMDPASAQGAPPPAKNAIHRFYDKLPVTYKQVDIAVKILVALFIIFLVVGVLKGNGVL